MATNHLIEASAQVQVEGIVIGQVEGEDGRDQSESSDDEDEEEEGEEAQQESSMKKEEKKVKKSKKNTQHKPLVLKEKVRKYYATCLECALYT